MGNTKRNDKYATAKTGSEVHQCATGRPGRLDRVDSGGAGGGLSAPGDAWHLAHSQGRCRDHSAGGIEELSADIAARRSRGGADIRRRPYAALYTTGAGGTGP